MKWAKRLSQSVRQFENIHLPLWLIKDTCWMLEWRIPGLLMIVPTVSVAILICLLARNNRELLMHLATLCWIVANSFWMWCEFFDHESWRYLSLVPFITGMGLVAVYYFRYLHHKVTGRPEPLQESSEG